MFLLRRTFRLSSKLIDGSCVNRLSSYPQQYHNHLSKFTINICDSQQFNTKANTFVDEGNLKNDKIEKHPIGKLESRLMIEFTCKKCKVRNSKTMTKLAYEKGVVIIRCDGCKNNHLIADNLGWFGCDERKRNIEKLMSLNGESVKRITKYGNEVFEAVKKNELMENEKNEDQS